MDGVLAIDWLQKKRTLLVHLRTVGQQQLDLIASGDLTSLLRVLASKQRVLDGLHLVSQQLAPFFAQEPHERRWADENERQQAAALVDECEQILVGVMELEQKGERQLSLTRDNAAAQLQGMHQASHVRGAYDAPDAPLPSSLDLSTH